MCGKEAKAATLGSRPVGGIIVSCDQRSMSNNKHSRKEKKKNFKKERNYDLSLYLNKKHKNKF